CRPQWSSSVIARAITERQRPAGWTRIGQRLSHAASRLRTQTARSTSSGPNRADGRAVCVRSRDAAWL
ncbi:MAG: hypothetical protein AAFV29_11370, partial [Myxococcota bacterium]